MKSLTSITTGITRNSSRNANTERDVMYIVLSVIYLRLYTDATEPVLYATPTTHPLDHTQVSSTVEIRK